MKREIQSFPILIEISTILRTKKKDNYRIEEGLTPEIVEHLSREKHDPEWMKNSDSSHLIYLTILKCLTGVHLLKDFNVDEIVTYVRPNTDMKADWNEVPEDIKNTFDRLGIPQAEKDSLAGVGAQYDSEVVYHNVRKEVERAGCYLHRYGKCS